MRSQVIPLATITGNGDTDVEVPVLGYDNHPEMVIQVDVQAGTITIQTLGSLDGSSTSYTEVIAATAGSQLVPIAAFPHLRFTATGAAGATAVVKALINSAPSE